MKKLQDLKLNAASLSREQMKNVIGGAGKCYRCCPEQACSSKPHACPDACGPIHD